ncbi:MAG: hypothetical protein Q8O31_06200 [Rhodocyclaceae bacterium]|nr:hypothetical protein [Rhodocyclaceae bacterium]
MKIEPCLHGGHDLKTFNNAGPSITEDHYMINPLTRIDLPSIESLIAEIWGHAEIWGQVLISRFQICTDLGSGLDITSLTA